MSNNDLVAKLITAPNQNERIKLIPTDEDFVFNFLDIKSHPYTAVGQDGFITALNPATFPALLLGGGAIGVGIIGPCGLNTPHVHPRATEITLNLGGGELKAQFIQENNVRIVNTTLPPGSATIFPKGSIHYAVNNGCHPVAFLASFDNVDPGVSSVATNLFKLDPDVLKATLPDIGVEYFPNLQIPPAIALGIQQCLKTCNIDPINFKFDGTFDDFFKAYETIPWPKPPGLPNSFGTWGFESEPTSSIACLPSQDVPFAQNPLRSTVMGLTATLVTLIMLAVYMGVTSKRRQRKTKNMFGAMSSDEVIVEYRDVVAPMEKA